MSKFTKNDLKAGMVVETALRRDRYLFVVDNVMIGDDKWENLNDYNNDLTHKYDSDLNIMKIYKPNSEYKMIPTNFYKLDEEDIIWERPHPFEFEKALDVMKQGKVVRSLTNDTLYKFGDDEFLTLNIYFQTWDEAFLPYNVITGQWIEEDDI